MRHSLAPASEPGLGPLPLVIGVTGHRDLRGEDREALEGRVQEIFTEMRTRYPHTPLILLSLLAEGADRLVARVALKNGARLIVPLPMPQDLYEEEAETLSGPLTYLLDCYAVVDTLAVHFQHLTQRTLVGLLIMVFWAAISFEISSWLPDQRWIQAVYLGMLLSAFAWYLWAKRRDYQNKYLDYRALAEGLRVQLFWWLAGLKDTVADHYLRRQRSELDWIRHAIRCWNLPAEIADEGLGATEAPALADRIRLVLAHWVQDQYAYFVRAAQRDHTLLEHLKHWG